VTKVQNLKLTADGCRNRKTTALATTPQQIIWFSRKILYKYAKFHSNDGRVGNFQTLKIQYDGRSPFSQSLYHHISVKCHQILVKFWRWGRLEQYRKSCHQNSKLLHPNWRTGAMLYIVVFGRNSTVDCPIFEGFWKIITQNPAIITVNATNFKLRKFKMSEDRHLENHMSPYFNEIGYNPILIKFSML